MNNRQGLALAVALLAVTLGCVLLLLSSKPERESERGIPHSKGMPHSKGVVPRAVRASLPPPPDVERPELPRERPEETIITPDDRRDMNFAVEGVLAPAREECLRPWLERIGEREAEFVFDAVLHDGRMADLGFRSLTHDLPPEVLDCVADHAWYADWPEWELKGELRLQRAITVSSRAAVSP